MCLSASTRIAKTHFLLIPLLGCVFVLTGCATPERVAFRADRYSLDVRLDPQTHGLTGRASIDLTRATVMESTTSGQVQVELGLHPALKVNRIAARGANVVNWRAGRKITEGNEQPTETRLYSVVLGRPVQTCTLEVVYGGELFQDVSAGEVLGQIHNLTMRAHVAPEGVFLSDGCWYPRPYADGAPVSSLADFSLVTDRVEGMELVAGAERDEATASKSGRLAWRSPYPIEHIALVGGQHEVQEAKQGSVTIRAHLKSSQQQHAAPLLEAVKRNLQRYEPLIGPYPSREYSVVDNFFSSGFAFPSFTLLSSAVIDMGERALKSHGYLDHEMLHSWWGNGVHVDPNDGNWCEALASYGANYYGYVLDGLEDEARRQRRNYVHFLSRLTPEKDRPLGLFGREGGPDRGVGYQKGAAVFHMLAQQMGQERFWSAMREFNREYLGKFASWADIQRVCERQSGLKLSPFFAQWVRRAGAPTIGIDSAQWDSAGRSLHIKLSQQVPVFDLVVPVRINGAGGESRNIGLPMREESAEHAVPLDYEPESVELDPDYHLFRRLRPEQIIPTTSATRQGNAFASVVPAGEVPEQYRLLRENFESSFEPGERIALTAGLIPPGALAERCTLVMGESVRDSYVNGFLSALKFPVTFTNEGFSVGGVAYNEPGHAVLCTVVHPGVRGGGVTVVYANSVEAIPRANAVPMYDRSLVVFKNQMPVLREDFEQRDTVTVTKER